MRSDKNIIELKIMISYRYGGSATTGNWNRVPIANCGERWRMGKTGKEYTVIGGHMGCHSSVEGPGAGALNNHLVEAGDETRLVLPARSAVRWRSGHRLGNLGRREGRVSLL